jgi:hypothetical protein
MLLRVVGILALFTLTACTTVSHTPLTQETSLQLREKSVTRTEYPVQDFAAFTAGKAAFAILGAAAMISEGNAIVKDNDIQDPAIAIGQGLADKLTLARNVSMVQPTKKATSDDIANLIETYAGTGYLLDVKTFNWMFAYYPTDWAHYRVVYNARLRLIDSTKKNVIAETMCSTTQGDDKNPPTKDQLLENKAALLKDYLSKAASTCVDLLAKDILKL